MNHFYLFSVATMIFSAMGLLGSFMLTRTSRTVAGRLMHISKSGSAVSLETPSAAGFVSRAFLDAVRWMRSRLGLHEKPDVLARLTNAGFRSAHAFDIYFGSRVVGPIIGILIGLLTTHYRFFWTTTSAGIFYLLPDILLTRLTKRRRENVRRSIPDAIDLLVICVDAGLGMDQAILRVGQELGTSHPQINEEFTQITLEQRAGKLRLAAWQAMAERSQLPEVDGFVNMLMQTERFGTPIARALSSYGDGIRLKRRQRAEELAAKTTVKIIFPLVLFIFPSLFIVLLGPAGINIARGLAHSSH